MHLVQKDAPSFNVVACMPDNSYEKISLEQYRGQYVVLYFYPAAFTFVCASETIDFHNQLSKFALRKCAVIGCSTDTQFTQRAWKVTEKADGGLGTAINHPLIADIKKEVAQAYDVLLEDEGLCLRGLFIIDPKGKVRCEMRNDLPIGRNVEEVIRTLDAIIFTDSNEGNVCPSSWKPGKEAMIASVEGVTEYLTKYT
jgi:alkyl hydroperoxide reductase subunit AhpC